MKSFASLFIFWAAAGLAAAAFNATTAYHDYGGNITEAVRIYNSLLNTPQPAEADVLLLRGHFSKAVDARHELEQNFSTMSEGMVLSARKTFHDYEETEQAIAKWLAPTSDGVSPAPGSIVVGGGGGGGLGGGFPNPNGTNNGGTPGVGGVGNGSRHYEIPGFENFKLIERNSHTGHSTILENRFGQQTPIDALSYYGRVAVSDDQQPISLGTVSGDEVARSIGTVMKTFSYGSKADVEKLASDMPLSDLEFLTQATVRPANVEPIDFSAVTSSIRQTRAQRYGQLTAGKNKSDALDSFNAFDQRLSKANLLNELKNHGEVGQQLIPDLLKGSDIDVVFNANGTQPFRVPVQKNSSVDIRNGALHIDSHQIDFSKIKGFTPAIDR